MVYQGFFRPKHQEKYLGDPTKIAYKSAWECKLFSFLDDHKDILEWTSDGLDHLGRPIPGHVFAIPYRCATDGKMHRYHPDAIVKLKDKNENIRVMIIEVKPYAQTLAPTQKKKGRKKYIREALTYGKNISKWRAAQAFCKDRGWEFQILTENELFGKKYGG